MPYSTGTQGAQANCAKYFMENALHTALTGGGFTYVEETAVSSQTGRIYKSPAGSNFFGQDWYLLVYRAFDSATQIYLGVAEAYNAGTHRATNYAPNNATMTPTASFAVNDGTGLLVDSWRHGAYAINILTTSFTYWLSITPDRVVIGTRPSGTDYAMYAGLYDDLQAASISPFPLVVGALNTTNSNSGAATREPNTTTSTPNCFQVCGLGIAPQTYMSTTTAVSVETYTGKYWISRFGITSYVGGSANSRVRGLLRDIWAGPATGVNGDTLNATINGVAKTLVCIQGSGGRSFVDTAL